jgi:hypothetical protein
MECVQFNGHPSHSESRVQIPAPRDPHTRKKASQTEISCQDDLVFAAIEVHVFISYLSDYSRYDEEQSSYKSTPSVEGSNPFSRTIRGSEIAWWSWSRGLAFSRRA